MKFSIILTTRNRCSDLRRTCVRIRALQPRPEEILVYADGCSDKTAEMIRREFPEFVFLENKSGIGSVGARDSLLRYATSGIVVCLDDDSYPLAGDFLARLACVFATHPEAAVVSFPELRDDGTFSHKSRTDKSPGHYVSTYSNCAAAMRRDFYLQRQGFPVFFVHSYEEPDYALQCYAAGSTIWFEPSLVVRHRLSNVGRVQLGVHHQHARNELWSVWMRCPWPWVPIISLFRVSRQFQYAYAQGSSWIIREPMWWYQALRGVSKCLRARHPIAWSCYFTWMRLGRMAAFTDDRLGSSALYDLDAET